MHTAATPSVVLFDLGGVLADFDPAPRSAAFAQRCDLTVAEVERRLQSDGFWGALDRGAYPSPEWRIQIGERLGQTFSESELFAINARAFRIKREVLAIARRVSLRATAGLLSNNAELLHGAMATHLAPIADCLSPLLFSYQYGYVKPDPKLYQAVGRRLGVPGNSLMLIDDRADNVRAAHREGWCGITFSTPTDLVSELRKYGLLDPRLDGS